MTNDFTVLGIKHGKAVERRYVGFSLPYVIKTLSGDYPEIKNVVILNSDNEVVYTGKDEEYRQLLFKAVCALSELQNIPYTDYKLFDKPYCEALKNVCEYVYKGLTLYT